MADNISRIMAKLRKPQASLKKEIEDEIPDMSKEVPQEIEELEDEVPQEDNKEEAKEDKKKDKEIKKEEEKDTEDKKKSEVELRTRAEIEALQNDGLFRLELLYRLNELVEQQKVLNSLFIKLMEDEDVDSSTTDKG